MRVVTSERAAVKILEALGLSTKKCLSLRIDFLPHYVVKATATYSVDSEGLDKTIEIIKTFEEKEHEEKVL